MRTETPPTVTMKYNSPMNEQEAWPAANREEIKAKIAKGYASAQRGDLIDASDARARLEARKRAWLAEHTQENRTSAC